MPKYSIQLIAATTAEWMASAYVIPKGELVAEEITTSGNIKYQLKMGDGVHTFSDLPYMGAQGEPGNDGISPTVEISNISDGKLITITDASGSQSFEVKNGINGTNGQGFVIKGTYATLSDLQTAIPSPSIGDAYAVGSNDSYNIYLYDGVNSTWTNVGSLSSATNTITINGGSAISPSNGTYSLTINKSTVGLGNVNNTSDANKPISTATQTALDSKEDKGKITIDNVEYSVRTSTTDSGSEGYITFVLSS